MWRLQGVIDHGSSSRWEEAAPAQQAHGGGQRAKEKGRMPHAHKTSLPPATSWLTSDEEDVGAHEEEPNEQHVGHACRHQEAAIGQLLQRAAGMRERHHGCCCCWCGGPPCSHACIAEGGIQGGRSASHHRSCKGEGGGGRRRMAGAAAPPRMSNPAALPPGCNQQLTAAAASRIQRAPGRLLQVTT